MKKPVKILLIILCVIFLCIFGFSGYKLYSIMHEYKVAADTYNNLSGQFVTVGPSADRSAQQKTPGSEEEEEEILDPEISPISVDFEGLLLTSTDVIGWIYGPDTVINYPVVMAEDNYYYLHRYIDGEYSGGGSIFADCLCERDFSLKNTILYGHHMNDGSMFASLRSYHQEGYYEEHPVLYLNTPKRNYRIEVFAGYITDADSDSYNVSFPSDEEFLKWIEKLRSQSDFATDVEIGAKDRIITLSTCSYEYYDARYVVQGKLVPIH